MNPSIPTSWHIRQAALGSLVAIILQCLGYQAVLALAMSFHLGWVLVRRKNQWTAPPALLRTQLITILRWMILLLASLMAAAWSGLALALTFWVAALLDILDGWYARRHQVSSAFGAFFDNEVDALFVLWLSGTLVSVAGLPWWVLLAGWARYLVIGIKSLWPPPSPPRPVPGGRAIAAFAFALLPFGFLFAGEWQWIVVGLPVIALLYSFTCELWNAYVPPALLRHLSRSRDRTQDR